jgi:hypothetical protein
MQSTIAALGLAMTAAIAPAQSVVKEARISSLKERSPR